MTELEWMQMFSNNLKSILHEKKITQRKLGQLTGIQEGTISKYLNCERMVSLKNAINISYALDYGVDELTDFGELIE